MSTPIFYNIYPVVGSTCNLIDGYTSVDIIDEYGIDVSKVDAYVNDSLVFAGPSTFYSPYTGTITSLTSIDGYDGYSGYRLSLTYPEQNSYFSVRVTAVNNLDSYGEDSWNFSSITSVEQASANPYEINLRIVFGGPILIDDNFTNVTNYQFTNGMYARYAEIPETFGNYANEIILWVELFYGQTTFQLSVNSLTDAYGCPVSATYNVVPFNSIADMTNYNGTVRTWHASNVIQSDSQRIYLAGDGGIDVFRKTSPSTVSRWGQIFDSYGVQSMFVSNFGTDYSFTDTSPPIIFNRDPAPSALWDNIGPITFSIADINTAVEIVNLYISINDINIFNGSSGGFKNGYYGNILVGYKNLSVVIYPPAEFPSGSDVYVNVIATDLLSNSLNTTYKFSIGIADTGFGVGQFGLFAFGT
jgi:hypothetical protein